LLSPHFYSIPRLGSSWRTKHSSNSTPRTPDRWHDSALVSKGAAEAVGEIQLAAAREVVKGDASQEQLERLMYDSTDLRDFKALFANLQPAYRRS
jgi:hypothetical protein